MSEILPDSSTYEPRSVSTLSANLIPSSSNSYVEVGSGLAPPRTCDGRPGDLTQFHLRDWIVSLGGHRLRRNLEFSWQFLGGSGSKAVRILLRL